MSIFGSKKRERALQEEIDRLNKLLSPEQSNIIHLQNQIKELEASKEKIQSDISQMTSQVSDLSSKINEQTKYSETLKAQIYNLTDDISLQEYGVYKPTFIFANSDLYKDKLKAIRDSQKAMIKDNKACTGDTGWTVNGNKSQGKKMVKDMQKLLLRAFNVECDDIIDNVKVSNFAKSKERIYKISEQISKLGTIMRISITYEYIDLKLEELNLALDFAQKKEEEKEQLKELREQQREEAKAQKEIEAARKKLQKEQSHYQNALTALTEQLTKHPDDPNLLAKRKELELNIADTEKAIQDVDYREANKRAGYVYIISNIGAFGENVYKIGMTRRLDPNDRINELGDASVPFNFDTHALIFSEDAPALEAALHKAFEDRKLNKINQRREFFRVSLEEIKAEVRKNFDKTVEWVDIAEAEQYRQSLLLQQKNL